VTHGPALILVNEHTRNAFEADAHEYRDGVLIAVGRYRYRRANVRGDQYRYGDYVARSWPLHRVEVVRHASPFNLDAAEA
jgi:hypothetical protein